ncbi:MAG: hypothetical protein M1570_00810 [Chloroflexi bacterium]|nr:hypothetical protein [Chloroflexota bacterium]
MKYLLLSFALVLAVAAVAGCAGPAPTPAPPPATATPPAMANKLIVFGDTVSFSGKDDPNSCTLKSRFKRGDAVGFRMTAEDPLSGKLVDTAKLVVHVTVGGKSADVPMLYRGTGANPHPGMWTAKWIVPSDAPTGVVQYTVTATDDQGQSGEYKPFQVEASELAVVN